ncbi:MAG: tRNA (N6-threonylcarbamoyladenosine(37)-N6)-methyltransferase TrmO [Alphaproteobacteria bacterium]|nr:tRNA (N6-threonylcarbamoyladenosine(37)-N6)-methyltransferase TrmO [Alphaproteobacteria bacterium]
MSAAKHRPGDVALPLDPAADANDARLAFIGRVRSPWTREQDCPKNLVQARERGGQVWLQVDEPWRPGLRGLEAHSHLLVLYWMDRARRDLIMQHPPHRSEAAGTFALRSPARPNPIAVATVQLLALDQGAGVLTIDAIDCLDGTPLLDIKPWMGAIDAATPAK